MRCEVVRIATPVCNGNPDGFTEINKADFDAAIHTLWVDDSDAKAKARAESFEKLKAEVEAGLKAKDEAAKEQAEKDKAEKAKKQAQPPAAWS